jgi:FKBP-type peptidyl-prolyl cis-trans isomerase
MTQPHTFAWSRRASGDVVITFDRKPVTTLRGKAAVRFLARIEGKGPEDSQQVMARFTGNFKRGNERR